jgi:hypothetical protein
MTVESMKMAPGEIPRPGRVPEQRLLSIEIGLRWRWRCRTFRGLMPDYLGFSPRREFIVGRAMSKGTRGAHTIGWHGQGVTRATTWCGQLGALLCLCFGLRLCDSKIGGLAFVSSNSENISCTTFFWNTKATENRNWHCGILLIG